MLTKKDACIAYARMLNKMDISEVETLLEDDFRLTSQLVLLDIVGKKEFVAYMNGKLHTIKSLNAAVYAELAKWNNEFCVLLAQNTTDNLVGTILISVNTNKITQADMCIIPTADSVVRSGIYPS